DGNGCFGGNSGGAGQHDSRYRRAAVLDSAVQGAAMSGAAHKPLAGLSFPHRWQAEVLQARPLILPARHFVYPHEAEEVERGALEVLVRPDSVAQPFLA